MLFLLAAATCASPLTVLARKVLPEPVARATDVRWDGLDKVVLTNARQGVYSLPIAPDAPASLLIEGGKSPDRIWLAGHLALSEEYLLVASPVFELVWQDRKNGSLQRDAVLEFIVDMDFHEDRLLLLGTRHDQDGTPSPNGALAWLAPFDDLPGGLEPIAFSAFGAGPQAMNACGSFELGHVRFFEDGRSLVAPGAEPTVYLFDRAGRLSRTWDTTEMGLDVPCSDLTMAQWGLLARDPDERWRWLDQFETIDEVLALPGVAAIIARRVVDGGTRWRALTLRTDGSYESKELPFTTQSKRSHLRADFDGERLVWLLREDDRYDRDLAVDPSLVITDWKGLLPAGLPTQPPESQSPAGR